MQSALLRKLTLLGYKAAAVPAARLEDLTRDMEALAGGPYRTEYIERMAKRTKEIDLSGLGFAARSLVVVATPSPVCRVTFVHDGARIETMLPPTYRDNEAKDAEVFGAIQGFLGPRNFHVEQANRLPQKLLAVRSGLGRYGRNNICYVDGFGSYANLCAYFTDIPCETEEWYPARMMERCAECGACANACPTGAIDAARPVINADICLTALNEHDGTFPDWLDKTCHACLVGCMRCQACCPENADRAGFIVQGCAFDEAETRAILAHRAGDAYPESVAAKIHHIGIDDYGKVLPRNLAALCQNRAVLSIEAEG